MSALFEPLALRSLTVRNRAWMSPMAQYSAATEGPDRGVPNDWHFAHYGARATGGVGLILTEATAVVPEGRVSPGDLGLWNDRQTEAFSRIARFLKAQGVVPGVQIVHAGRKASTRRAWEKSGPLTADEGSWPTVAPSPLPFSDVHPVPKELTLDGIREVIAQFVAAARRALTAGFQVIELHGAHGYLLAQFLSPHSNHRTDTYGGPFENRIRFPLQVVDAVREVWPDDLPLFYRISATDWLDHGGWTPDETVRFAKELLARGVDLLDVSTGGNVSGVHIPTGPGYQVPFAARVKAETALPVATVGEITHPRQAETVIRTGQADAVFLARELLRNPSWPLHAAHELGAPDAAAVPNQYLRAYPRAAR